jgi:hypothetical protein
VSYPGDPEVCTGSAGGPPASCEGTPPTAAHARGVGTAPGSAGVPPASYEGARRLCRYARDVGTAPGSAGVPPASSRRLPPRREVLMRPCVRRASPTASSKRLPGGRVSRVVSKAVEAGLVACGCFPFDHPVADELACRNDERLSRISHSHLLRHRMSRPGLRQSHRSDPHCAGSTAPVGSASLPCQDTTYGTSRTAPVRNTS